MNPCTQPEVPVDDGDHRWMSQVNVNNLYVFLEVKLENLI